MTGVPIKEWFMSFDVTPVKDFYVDCDGTVRLTCSLFMSLPEYSGTVPTGVTQGKMWRRLHGAHVRHQGYRARWYLLRYDDPFQVGGATHMHIRWFKPILRLPA